MWASLVVVLKPDCQDAFEVASIENQELSGLLRSGLWVRDRGLPNRLQPRRKNRELGNFGSPRQAENKLVTSPTR